MMIDKKLNELVFPHTLRGLDQFLYSDSFVRNLAKKIIYLIKKSGDKCYGLKSPDRNDSNLALRKGG